MVLYGASKEFQDQFVELAKKFKPSFSSHINDGMSTAVQTKDYTEFGKSYYNALIMVSGLEMHLAFMKKMGIGEDNFLTTYLKSLKRVPGSHGPSEIVEVYMEEGQKETK